MVCEAKILTLEALMIAVASIQQDKWYAKEGRTERLIKLFW